MAEQGVFVKKILIFLFATVAGLLLALVFLNKQLKTPQQEPQVTAKQNTERDRLPPLSELTGQNKETAQADLMPLPGKPQDSSDKNEADTIVSIDGETCEKLPPLGSYVLQPVAKPQNEAGKTQEQPAAGQATASSGEAAGQSPAKDEKAGQGASAPMAQAQGSAAPAQESTQAAGNAPATADAAPAAQLSESSRQELTNVLAGQQSGSSQPYRPGKASDQSPAAQASSDGTSFGASVTAPLTLPPKDTGPALQERAGKTDAQKDMAQGRAAKNEAKPAMPASEATAPVTLPQKDKEPADQKKSDKADAKKNADAGQAASTDKAEKPARAQKQEQRAAQGTEPKIVIFSRENGATVRITMDRKIPYKQMLLTNPDRLVIDISGEYKNMQAPAFPDNEFVSGIRIGHYDSRTRFVFDLKEKPARHHTNQSGDKKRLDVRLDK